jgi:Transposase IS116/IS110/IS902 family
VLVNALRGHAAEFGVIAGKGLGKIGPLLAAVEQEVVIPSAAKDMAALLGKQIADLDTKIKEIEVNLIATHKANPVSQRLATIPGVGPITALTLAIEIDPAAFESVSAQPGCSTDTPRRIVWMAWYASMPCRAAVPTTDRTLANRSAPQLDRNPPVTFR